MPTKPIKGGRVDLAMLDGTEDSIQSNFEALCCKLYQAEYPDAEVNRLSPPDGGIDFIGELPQGIVAFQCKYFLRRIRRSQIQQIHKSFATSLSKRSSMVKQWKEYHLLIALDPTDKEYQTIQQLFETLRKKYNASNVIFKLVGKAKIEQLLAKHLYLWQEYRSPTVLIEYQPGIPFPSNLVSRKKRKGDITVYCRSRIYGTTARAYVSPHISCETLAGIFATQLGLLSKVHLPEPIGEIEYYYELENQTGERFPNALSIKDAGVKEEEVLFLVRIRKPEEVEMMAPDMNSFDWIYSAISSDIDISFFEHEGEKKRTIALVALFFIAIDNDEILQIRERAIQELVRILKVEGMKFDIDRLNTYEFIESCDLIGLAHRQYSSINDFHEYARKLLTELEHGDRIDLLWWKLLIHLIFL